MPSLNPTLRTIWWRCAAFWFCVATALTANFYWGAADGWRDLDIARHQDWTTGTVTAMQPNQWDFDYAYQVNGQPYTGSG